MEAAPRAARKVITALFADVVGSTALGERLDPEDLQEVVGDGVARIVRAAEELGGHVERVAGDGALILFGAPVAHEDDAERAVLAGLRILAAIDGYADALARERGLEGFAVRVGIETGTAVLAALGGTRPIEFGATGDVLNTAARLEAAADPGTMVVGPHTFEVVETCFDWAEPRELSLKGKAGVVLGHRPLAVRSPDGRRRPAAEEAPLVGREPELAALTEALDRLRAGTGGVVVLSGEPGLGKTRLLRELRRRTEARSPSLWLEGRCLSYGQRLPYFPFQVLLRDWLGGAPDGADADLARRLEERVADLLPGRALDVRPFIASVLGIAQRPEDAARTAGLGSDDLQAASFGAVTELLRELTREAPVVLALEDLHWADATSLALTESLPVLAAECPLLIVLTARLDAQSTLARLATEASRRLPDRTVRLELSALAEEADRALLGALSGGAGLPPELERRMLERAEGNPLYLEELVRALVDAGALVRVNGGWRHDPRVQVQVPETVEKLVLARVDVLSPVARELLSAAAVLGRRFTRELLAQVAGDASALEELIGAGLVLELSAAGEGDYRFKHHLIQEATYGSLLKRPRQELHRRAAAAIEAASAGRVEEPLGVLAHHWTNAGDLERALDLHVRAGDAAEFVGAPDEALEHYAAGRAAAEELGLAPGDRRVARVAMRLARALVRTGRGDGFHELETALAGAREIGDREIELEALSQFALFRHGGYANAVALGEQALEIARSLDDERAQVYALARLAILDANRLALERALAEGLDAVAIARRAGDDEALGLALDGLKLAELKLGHLPEVARDTAELIEIHRRRGNPFYLGWALLESAYPLLGSGRLDAARERAQEALALNQRLGDRGNEPLFHDCLCWIERASGRYGDALRHGRTAVACARERGSGEWRAWCSASLSWVLLDLRAAEEAVPLLEAGAEEARAEGADGEVLRCLGLLSWAHWLAGDREAALPAADEAEARLARVTAPPGDAWLFGAHAQLALARVQLAAGRPEAAAAVGRMLLDAAKRRGWRDAAAATAVVLAGCERALGRADAAIGLLETAVEMPVRDAAAWEARFELATLDASRADRLAAEARALLDAVVADLGDDPAAAALTGADLSAPIAG